MPPQLLEAGPAAASPQPLAHKPRPSCTTWRLPTPTSTCSSPLTAPGRTISGTSPSITGAPTSGCLSSRACPSCTPRLSGRVTFCWPYVVKTPFPRGANLARLTWINCYPTIWIPPRPRQHPQLPRHPERVALLVSFNRLMNSKRFRQGMNFLLGPSEARSSLYITLVCTLGWQCFTKSQKQKREMWFSHSLDPKDSKKSKFDHLEGLLVVLARTWSLWSELH